jgi:NAD(P)-dependent dehydrogenase (short-subunit alcohol dehydrogenase family)
LGRYLVDSDLWVVILLILALKGIATAYAKANANSIVISARKVADLKATEELIHEINPGIEVLCAALEITSEEFVKEFFDQIKARFGTVDVLVNNAGLFRSEGHFLRSASLDILWEDIVSLFLESPFY